MIRTNKLPLQYHLSRDSARTRAPLPRPEQMAATQEENFKEPYTPTWIVYRPIFKRTVPGSPIPKILVRKNEHRNKFRETPIDSRILTVVEKEEGSREYKSALKDVEDWIQEMTLSESPAPACFNESLFSFLNE